MTTLNDVWTCVFHDDDVNTVLLKIKCGERKVETAKYSELITCPLIKFIYFRIKK